MRIWFELGRRIGYVDFVTKLSGWPGTFISVEDIENYCYEISEYMTQKGVNSQKLLNAKIDKYEDIALELIKPPNVAAQRQLLLLGIYIEKLRLLLTNELDNVFGEQRSELRDYISQAVEALGLPKYLGKISIKKYKDKEFDRIARAIKNDIRFDKAETLPDPQKVSKQFKIEIVVAILVAIISALATIAAAIISRL